MKPAKASELLLDLLSTRQPWENPDYPDAIKTGIFGLKRLLKMRSYNIGMAIMPLPGENPIPDLSPSADRKQRLRESPLGVEPK